MVTTLNRQNPLRLDAAPTEVQMKLGISQVLSMPFAYNSPVIVLDFEVGNKNIIKGRFKDAIRPRVFEFEIGDSITFKPFTWKRTDSLDVDPVAWEDYSKGYCYRFDAVKTVRKEKPTCGNTSYNCGKACIGLNKNCKSDPPDKPSQEKVDKLRAAAGEFKAVQDDPTRKQEDNKLTPKPPDVKAIAKATPEPKPASIPAVTQREVTETDAKKNPVKSVYQQYKDIIASSKDPKGTEEAITEALAGTLDYKKQTYERYLAAQTSGTVPPGYEKHYQEHIDQYKPVIEAEQFFSERRQKAVNGDFETESEVMAYMGSLKGKYKNSYEFYDSPEYTEKRSKIESIVKNNYELPPPLSGNIPRSELKKTLSPGDKLLIKEPTYGYAGSSGSKNIPTGYNIREGGEVTKVAVTNVVAKKQYGGQQNAFESKTPMKDITHIIRDGKRYKVDDSDSSPNDLKPETTKTQKAVKQKTIKVQGERSQEQESPLVPKEEIVKESPKRIGDGTHEGTPKNAQEYSDMMTKKGQKFGIRDAEGVIESVKEWSENAYQIREDQKNGRSSKDADNLDLFIKQSTPFPGEISRGLQFDSQEELDKFVKGEDGILGNQNAHASWTSNYEKAKDFAGMNLSSAKKTYPVIVKAPNKSGVSIRNLSTFGQEEDEVVVSKNTRHKIKSVRKEGNLTIVETEEVSEEPITAPPKEQKTAKIKELTPRDLPPITKDKIGDGTLEGAPRNAKEYLESLDKIDDRYPGNYVTPNQAEGVIASVKKWTTPEGYQQLRNDQKNNVYNGEVQYINSFIKNLTPYNGEISRGMSFANKEQAMSWLTGDEHGFLDNQSAHSSWSADFDVAQKYAKSATSQGSQPVVIRAVNKSGVSVQPLSDRPEENEVLVPKTANHRVKSIKEENGVLIAEVEEYNSQEFFETKYNTTSQPSGLIGKGDHRSTPRNADAYYKAMAAKGDPITEEEAVKTFSAVTDWSVSGYIKIRREQQVGVFNENAELIGKFVKQLEPYQGEVYRGISFGSEDEARAWAAGDYSSGKIEQDAHASWSSSEKAAEDFAWKGSYKRQAVLLKSVNNKSGASIANMSDRPAEMEVLVPKGAAHKVRNITKKGELLIIEVEEI